MACGVGADPSAPTADIGTENGGDRFPTQETVEALFGVVRALWLDMEAKNSKQMWTLSAELCAIEFWNTAFRRKQAPEEYERAAFHAREERRKEIIRKLTALTSRNL